LVHVTTDAPLPPAFGTTLGATDPVPLFDRLRTEIFTPASTIPCGGCTAEFALDRDLVRSGKVSFGFVPPPNASGYLARVTLYRAIAIQADVPIAQASVTSVIELPPVKAEGIVDVAVTLKVDDIGRSQGTLSQPTAATLGKPDYAIVGTWAGAQRHPCVTIAKPGEVCIQGGAFWMGDPTQGAATPQDDVSIPRLVVLSPFFLQATEVTVATFRASGMAKLDPVSGLATDPAETVNNGTLDDIFSTCTYTSTPNVKAYTPPPPVDSCGRAVDAGAVGDAAPPPDDASILWRTTDALPVTCISWVKATEYCNSLGGDLPTEAQFEFVAGGMRSQRHVWGTDDPTCADAVWGRDQTPEALCRAAGTLGAPLPPGSGARDRLSVGGGVVVDLAGNVDEWVRDMWNRISEPCWTPSLLRDPLCETPTVLDALPVVDAGTVSPSSDSGVMCPAAPDAGDGGGPMPSQDSLYVVKGSGWLTATAANVRATRRFSQGPYRRGPGFGFRCARTDR
jgi:formylglycine-generating enzyme required for sulfatase activity